MQVYASPAPGETQWGYQCQTVTRGATGIISAALDVAQSVKIQWHAAASSTDIYLQTAVNGGAFNAGDPLSGTSGTAEPTWNSANAGETIAYRLYYKANGTTDAYSQTVSIDLPEISTAVSLSSTGAVAGSLASVTLGTIYGAGSSAPSYTALIDWGDNSSSTGAVVANGSNADITGSHAYASAGTYAVQVSVSGPGEVSTSSLKLIVASQTTQPDAPSQLSCSRSTGYPGPAGKAELTWEDSNGDSCSVQRSSDGVTFTTIHPTITMQSSSGTYIYTCTDNDTTLVDGKAYTYRVVAVSGGVSSLPSNAISFVSGAVTQLTETSGNFIDLSLDDLSLVDTGQDDILDVDADLTSFGNDTGMEYFQPQRQDAQTMIPLATYNTDGVAIHAYLSSGAYTVNGDAANVCRIPDSFDTSFSYSLDTRVLLDRGVNSWDKPSNHNDDLYAWVVRPRGNVVVFQFTYADGDYTVGLPVGVNALSQMVLRYTGDEANGGPDFDLDFASGVTHEFQWVTESGTNTHLGGDASSYTFGASMLVAVKTASGDTIDVSQPYLINGENNGKMTVILPTCNLPREDVLGLLSVDTNGNVTDASGNDSAISPCYTITIHYSSSIDFAQQALQYVDFKTKDGLHTIRTTAALDKVDMATDEEISEFSYARGPGDSIVHDGATITRTSSVTGGGAQGSAQITYTTTLDGVSGSTATTIALNGFGMETSEIDTLTDALGVTTSSITSYQYASATTGRYESEAAGKWAKISQINYSDGSWAKFQYDSATGWVTQENDPFKSSLLSDPDSKDRVTTYAYSPSSNDQTNNPVERPSEITSYVGGHLTSDTFIQYAGMYTYTREADDPTHDTATTAPLEMVDERNTYGPDSVWTPSGATVYSTILGSDGTLSIDEQTYGPPAGVTFTGTVSGAESAPPQGTELQDTVTTFDAFGNATSSETTDWRTQYVVAQTTSTPESFGRITSTVDNLTNQTISASSYQLYGTDYWFGPATTTDISMVTTTYSYTTWGAVQSSTTFGIASTDLYDAAGNVIQGTASTPPNGPRVASISAKSTFNAQGVATSTSDANKSITAASSVVTQGTAISASGPAGNKTITKTNLDGSPLSVSGSATDPSSSDSGIDKLYDGTDESGFWTKSIATSSTNVTAAYYNLLGQVYMTTETMAGSTSPLSAYTYYDPQGRVTKYVEYDGSVTTNTYDSDTGELSSSETVLEDDADVGNSGNPTAPVVTANTTDVDKYSTYKGQPVYESQSTVVGDTTEDNSVTATYISLDGLDTWQVTPTGTTETDTVYNNSGWTVTTTNPDGTKQIAYYVNELLHAVDSLDAKGNLTGSMDYGYDELRRNNSVTRTDSSGISSTEDFGLRADGTIDSIFDPSTDTLQEVLQYDPKTGLPTVVLNADGTTSNYTVDPRGFYSGVSGGDTAAMTTTDDATTGTQTLTTHTSTPGGLADTSGTTTWQTDLSSGLLTKKTFDDQSADNYSYQNGRLSSIDLAGLESIAYTYTAGGLVNKVDYTSDLPSGQSMEYRVLDYDRQGNDRSDTFHAYGGDLSISHSYDSNGDVTAENIGDTLSTDIASLLHSPSFTYGMSYQYNPADQQQGAGELSSSTLSYDGASLATGYTYTSNTDDLQSVYQTGGPNFTYTYKPDSSTLASVQASNGVTTSYGFDPDSGVLKSVTVTNSANQVLYKVSYDSFYPDGQREKVTTTRLVGTTLQTTYVIYGYDSYNQLDSIETYNPGAVTPTSTQTFTFDAMGNRIDGGFTLTSTNDNKGLNQYTTISAGGPTLTYDTVGNLTFDGSYHYSFDPLNRLVKAENAAYTQEVLFTYDNGGRRLTKEVVNGSGGIYDTAHPASFTEFAYDGWNLVAEIDGMTGHLIRSYTWDPTSSGPGGLLSITTYDSLTGAKTGVYNAFSDGNGNVMGLTEAQTGALVASYTYSAFGQLLTSTGSAASACPFLFSTKYFDAETGLYYSDMRYYSPTMGRFITRDPSGEDSGVNLYAYCGNDPLNKTDPLGLTDYQSFLQSPSGGFLVNTPTNAYVPSSPPSQPLSMSSLTLDPVGIGSNPYGLSADCDTPSLPIFPLPTALGGPSTAPPTFWATTAGVLSDVWSGVVNAAECGVAVGRDGVDVSANLAGGFIECNVGTTLTRFPAPDSWLAAGSRNLGRDIALVTGAIETIGGGTVGGIGLAGEGPTLGADTPVTAVGVGFFIHGIFVMNNALTLPKAYSASSTATGEFFSSPSSSGSSSGSGSTSSGGSSSGSATGSPTGGTGGGPSPSPTNPIFANITPKIAKQMGPRGWTQQSIEGALKNPVRTGTAINRATGNPATAYFTGPNQYVVVDNVTHDIVQVSDLTDPNWNVDSGIK